jgi:hypothetical protein
MKKVLIILFSFYIGLIIFMPKKELLYKSFEYLPFKVDAKIISNPIYVKLENSKIIYTNVNSAYIKELQIFPFIFYNQINVKELRIFNKKFSFKVFVLPHRAFIRGDINGYIDFLNKKIDLLIKNPPPQIRGFLKYSNKGYILDEIF